MGEHGRTCLTDAQRHQDRCPSCGSDDTTSDFDHRDGCERMDNCGQFGPPWVDPPFHPESDLVVREVRPRLEGESWSTYHRAVGFPWLEAVYDHRRSEHPELSPLASAESSRG